MPDITPCLWFERNAEEAVRFYTSIFKNSKVGRIARYTEVGREFHRQEPGTPLTIEFELDGRRFTALNGGSKFRFNEAISLQVHCATQDEIDYCWEKLSEGGDPSARQCGWLKDKFGLSWQVVPAALGEWMQSKEPGKADRVMGALLRMKKLDIRTLQEA